MNRINLENQRFGRLVVLSPSEEKGTQGQLKWNCRCDCGKHTVCFSHNLRRGFSRSCGQCSNDYFVNIDGSITLLLGNKHGEEFQRCLIDAEDFARVTQYRWGLNDNGYVTNRKMGTLHRFLLNPTKEQCVDHISGDKLDNRKDNLRPCTKAENCWNQKANSNNSLGIKNIYRRKDNGRYSVCITKHEKKYGKAGFETLEEAIEYRDYLLVKLHGEFARLD